MLLVNVDAQHCETFAINVTLRVTVASFDGSTFLGARFRKTTPSDVIDIAAIKHDLGTKVRGLLSTHARSDGDTDSL